jgi:hypothetical protein
VSNAKTLSELLLTDPKKRPPLLDDLVRFIDDEVAAKSGLSGLAIKGAYKVVAAIKPGVIREAMDSLLDDFVKRVEPIYARFAATGEQDPRKFADYLSGARTEAADLLLGVTDDRAKRAKNKTMKGAYDKLRPHAKKYVEEAVPGAARVFARHI